MNKKIEIDGKKYEVITLEVLNGARGEQQLERSWLPIAQALDNPAELPFLLKVIADLKENDDLRMAIVRIQVDSELNMREDLSRHQKRLYVARTIEKLIFGGLKLQGKGGKSESNGNGADGSEK